MHLENYEHGNKPRNFFAKLLKLDGNITDYSHQINK